MSLNRVITDLMMNLYPHPMKRITMLLIKLWMKESLTMTNGQRNLIIQTSLTQSTSDML